MPSWPATSGAAGWTCPDRARRFSDPHLLLPFVLLERTDCLGMLRRLALLPAGLIGLNQQEMDLTIGDVTRMETQRSLAFPGGGGRKSLLQEHAAGLEVG